VALRSLTYTVGAAPSPRMTSGFVISSEAQIRGQGAAPTENNRFPVVPQPTRKNQMWLFAPPFLTAGEERGLGG